MVLGQSAAPVVDSALEPMGGTVNWLQETGVLVIDDEPVTVQPLDDLRVGRGYEAEGTLSCGV